MTFPFAYPFRLLSACAGCRYGSDLIQHTSNIRIDADANLSTGAITVAEQDEDGIVGKMEDGGEMFIDFGNGVEHPVAINEEQQEENDDTFFYLE